MAEEQQNQEQENNKPQSPYGGGIQGDPNKTPDPNPPVKVLNVAPAITPDQVVGLNEEPAQAPVLPTIKLQDIKLPKIENKTLQGHLKAIEAKMIATEKLMKDVVKLQNLQIVTEKELFERRTELYQNTFEEYLLDRTIDFGEDGYGDDDDDDCTCVSLPRFPKFPPLPSNVPLRNRPRVPAGGASTPAGKTTPAQQPATTTPKTTPKTAPVKPGQPTPTPAPVRPGQPTPTPAPVPSRPGQPTPSPQPARPAPSPTPVRPGQPVPTRPGQVPATPRVTPKTPVVPGQPNVVPFKRPKVPVTPGGGTTGPTAMQPVAQASPQSPMGGAQPSPESTAAREALEEIFDGPSAARPNTGAGGGGRPPVHGRVPTGGKLGGGGNARLTPIKPGGFRIPKPSGGTLARGAASFGIGWLAEIAMNMGLNKLEQMQIDHFARRFAEKTPEEQQEILKKYDQRLIEQMQSNRGIQGWFEKFITVGGILGEGTGASLERTMRAQRDALIDNLKPGATHTDPENLLKILESDAARTEPKEIDIQNLPTINKASGGISNLELFNTDSRRYFDSMSSNASNSITKGSLRNITTKLAPQNNYQNITKRYKGKNSYSQGGIVAQYRNSFAKNKPQKPSGGSGMTRMAPKSVLIRLKQASKSGVKSSPLRLSSSNRSTATTPRSTMYQGSPTIVMMPVQNVDMSTYSNMQITGGSTKLEKAQTEMKSGATKTPTIVPLPPDYISLPPDAAGMNRGYGGEQGMEVSPSKDLPSGVNSPTTLFTRRKFYGEK